MTDVHETFETLRGLWCVSAFGELLTHHRDRLGSLVIDNTERGLRLSVIDIGRAYTRQTRLARRFADLFDEVDVLICPAASVSPFPHQRLFIDEINGDKMHTYMHWLAIAYAPTMALACVAVLPCGRDHAGMPFGIQIIGPVGTDAKILEIAYALEQVLAQDKTTAQPSIPR
jgi:Asp-tRNA(Asn)/Glu-tRNA(Gln) amidotransferase A subunit family amidase